MDIAFMYYSFLLRDLLREGKFASAAHVVRYAVNCKIFDNKEQWRTAALLHLEIDEIMAMSKKKRKAKRIIS